MQLTPDQRAARTLLGHLLRPTTTPIDTRRLTAALAAHAQPLTLLALRDTLSALAVDTLATRLTPAQLQELPCPAVAYLGLGTSGCFVVVYAVDERTVTWRHPDYGRLSTTHATFARVWTGIVLMAELEYRADAPDGRQRGWRRLWPR